MEKYNLNLKKLFSKREVRVFNPHVHWMILVRTFSVLFILAVLSSVYFFNQIRDEKIFHERNVSTPENNLITRNQKLLDRVSDYFTEKENKMNSLKKDGLNLDDPRIQK